MEVEGEGYTLKYESAKKIIFLMKLTDSALRSIEEYQEKNTASLKPSIYFSSNQGKINIPCGNNADGQDFTFQLSSHNQSSDCLQQSKMGEGGFSVLGAIQHKITVNANEESYDATRKRMTLVKELEQKTSTKVIKQPNTKKGNSKFRRIQQNQPSSFPRNCTPPPPKNRYTPTQPFNRSSSPMGTHRSESPVTNLPEQAGKRNKTKPVLSSMHSSAQSQTARGKPQLEKTGERGVTSSDARKRPQTLLDAKPKDLLGTSPAKRDVEDSYTDPVKKKARISLYSKTSPNAGSLRARSLSPLERKMPNATAAISSSTVVDLSPSESSRTKAGYGSYNSSQDTGFNDPAPPPPPSTQSQQKTKKAPKEASENSSGLPKIDSSEIRDVHSENSIAENEEFTRKYKAIHFSEQRDQYKNDFFAEYKEYLRLHEKVAAHAKRFQEWQRQIKKLERGTDQYKRLARKVFDEYHKIKEDNVFGNDRDRLSYLHRKLKHIKSLVLDYDSRETR